MEIYNINISLEQLVALAAEDNGLEKRKKDSIESYISLMEEVVPVGVYNRASRLIKDEGVDVDAVAFTIIDEGTGKTYPYNPPLGLVFS